MADSKSTKKPKPYIVALPAELRGLSEDIRRDYQRIPNTGVTMAYSEGDAVGNYIFRFLGGSEIGESSARIIMRALTNNSGNKYSKYAMEMPVVFGEGEVLTRRERMTFEEMALAQNLAGVYGGRPESYLKEASHLADKIRESELSRISREVKPAVRKIA